MLGGDLVHVAACVKVEPNRIRRVVNKARRFFCRSAMEATWELGGLFSGLLRVLFSSSLCVYSSISSLWVTLSESIHLAVANGAFTSLIRNLSLRLVLVCLTISHLFSTFGCSYLLSS